MSLFADHWRQKGEFVFRRLQDASENLHPMRVGEHNRDAVILLQQALIMTGYPIPAGATGNYGEQTAAAVRAVQADPRLNLGRDIGIAGKEVLEALDGRLQARVHGASVQTISVPFEFVIDGRTYRSEGNDIAGQLDRVINAVYNRLQAALDARQGFVARQNGFVRMISDALGTADGIPPPEFLFEGIQACSAAWRALAQQDFLAAKEKIDEALIYYNAAHRQWRRYIRGTWSGADTARDALEVFSAVALTLSTTYLGAGATVPGAVIVSAARGAAITGGITAIREVGVQSHERIIDLDPEVNWRAMASTIVASAGASFASSALGGWLRPHVLRIFPGTMSDLANSEAEWVAWNQTFARFGISPIPAIPSTWSRIAARVLTSIPQSVLATTAKATIIEFGTGLSLDEFLKRWWKNLPRDIVVRAIGQALVGIAPPP